MTPHAQILRSILSKVQTVQWMDIMSIRFIDSQMIYSSSYSYYILKEQKKFSQKLLFLPPMRDICPGTLLSSESTLEVHTNTAPP